ncbi:hypothetical protein ACFLRF_03725 [Candidatus Altiarchaeota archaeon]
MMYWLLYSGIISFWIGLMTVLFGAHIRLGEECEYDGSRTGFGHVDLTMVGNPLMMLGLIFLIMAVYLYVRFPQL